MFLASSRAAEVSTKMLNMVDNALQHILYSRRSRILSARTDDQRVPTSGSEDVYLAISGNMIQYCKESLITLSDAISQSRIISNRGH